MPNYFPRFPRRPARPARTRGFSMLEALVSVVVLSMGLLGVAALQGVGLRANSSASYRSQAAWFAAQMIEEARAQRAGVISGGGGVVGTLGSAVCNSAGSTPLARWQARIACALPSGQGGVAYNAFTQRLTVTVRWDDSRGVDSATAGGNSNMQFQIDTVL